MELNVKFDQKNKVIILGLNGRLDVDGIQAIENEFHHRMGQAEHPVILDMAGAEFLGSMGIRMLLVGAKTLRKNGFKAVLFNPQPMVEETWYSAGLAEIFPVEHDYANAMLTLHS